MKRPEIDPIVFRYSANLKIKSQQLIHWKCRLLVVMFLLFLLFGSIWSVYPAWVLMSLALMNFIMLLVFRIEFALRTHKYGEDLLNKSVRDENVSGQNIHMELPAISAIVPLKHEGEIIYSTLRSISRIDYPASKMEVLIIVEADDQYTLSFLNAVKLPFNFHIIKIDCMPPFTKGRALLHGLEHAKGDIITVYDAESNPHTLQFQHAASAFLHHGADQCYQAIIRISNLDANLMTKFFAGEYFDWYEKYLAYVSDLNFPFGLGGNSFFIRKDLLMQCGAWDAFNVTEDAELSVRLYQNNIKTKLIHTTTKESCPETVLEWLKQRVRWNKGLMITQIMHMAGVKDILKGLPVNKWFRFWSRMLTGIMLPFSTLYILLFFMTSNPLKSILYPTTMSFLLFVFLAFSILVSIWSDRRTFRNLNIKMNPFQMLFGTIMYMSLYIVAGFIAYFEYFFAPLKWNKTHHPAQILEEEVSPSEAKNVV